MRLDVEIAPLFEQQHGLVTRAQVLEHGSVGAIRQRLEAGLWLPVERAVYRLSSHSASWEQSLLAHCLGMRAVASHRCAAALWELDGCRRARPEVTVVAGAAPRRTGVTVHQSKRPDLFNETTRSGIPATGMARTLFDLAGVVSPGRLQQAVDDARRRELVTFDDLYRLFVNYAKRGRSGSAAMRAFLDHPDGDLPASHWSRRVAIMLIEAGLPAPQLEYPVPAANARIDLAYPAQMVGIELDSIAWHLNRESFTSDRRRRNRLENLGWRILNFTWEDYQRSGHIVDVVRSALTLTAPSANFSR